MKIKTALITVAISVIIGVFAGQGLFNEGKHAADRYYAWKITTLTQSLAECSKGNAEGAENKMLLDGCEKVRDSLIKRHIPTLSIRDGCGNHLIDFDPATAKEDLVLKGITISMNCDKPKVKREKKSSWGVANCIDNQANSVARCGYQQRAIDAGGHIWTPPAQDGEIRKRDLAIDMLNTTAPAAKANCMIWRSSSDGNIHGTECSESICWGETLVSPDNAQFACVPPAEEQRWKELVKGVQSLRDKGWYEVTTFGSKAQRWIIFADLFHGCGYIDAQGKEQVYENCETSSTRIYWNGHDWSTHKDEAKVYDRAPDAPPVHDWPEGSHTRDVVQIQNLETWETYP